MELVNFITITCCNTVYNNNNNNSYLYIALVVFGKCHRISESIRLNTAAAPTISCES